MITLKKIVSKIYLSYQKDKKGNIPALLTCTDDNSYLLFNKLSQEILPSVNSIEYNYDEGDSCSSINILKNASEIETITINNYGFRIKNIYSNSQNSSRLVIEITSDDIVNYFGDTSRILTTIDDKSLFNILLEAKYMENGSIPVNLVFIKDTMNTYRWGSIYEIDNEDDIVKYCRLAGSISKKEKDLIPGHLYYTDRSRTDEFFSIYIGRFSNILISNGNLLNYVMTSYLATTTEDKLDAGLVFNRDIYIKVNKSEDIKDKGTDLVDYVVNNIYSCSVNYHVIVEDESKPLVGVDLGEIFTCKYDKNQICQVLKNKLAVSMKEPKNDHNPSPTLSPETKEYKYLYNNIVLSIVPEILNINPNYKKEFLYYIRESIVYNIKKNIGSTDIELSKLYGLLKSGSIIKLSDKELEEFKKQTTDLLNSKNSH